MSEILSGLGLEIEASDLGWQVQIPSFRFDIDVEDALVEEVARIYGYDEIPEQTAIASEHWKKATRERSIWTKSANWSSRRNPSCSA